MRGEQGRNLWWTRWVESGEGVILLCFGWCWVWVFNGFLWCLKANVMLVFFPVLVYKWLRLQCSLVAGLYYFSVCILAKTAYEIFAVVDRTSAQIKGRVVIGEAQTGSGRPKRGAHELSPERRTWSFQATNITSQQTLTSPHHHRFPQTSITHTQSTTIDIATTRRRYNGVPRSPPSAPGGQDKHRSSWFPTSRFPDQRCAETGKAACCAG